MQALIHETPGGYLAIEDFSATVVSQVIWFYESYPLFLQKNISVSEKKKKKTFYNTAGQFLTRLPQVHYFLN